MAWRMGTSSWRSHFSEPVSIQHSGIVLVFQEYDPSTQKVSGTNINSFFVSKEQIALLSGAGVNFTFVQWFGNQFVSKYLYINDTKITEMLIMQLAVGQETVLTSAIIRLY